jgi:hypothetical protein
MFIKFLNSIFNLFLLFYFYLFVFYFYLSYGHCEIRTHDYFQVFVFKTSAINQTRPSTLKNKTEGNWTLIISIMSELHYQLCYSLYLFVNSFNKKQIVFYNLDLKGVKIFIKLAFLFLLKNKIISFKLKNIT